jgi:hypothetical protein
LEQAQRLEEAPGIASIMKAAHSILFDAARQCMEDVLQPTRLPDQALRSAVQFKRTMYGNRLLDKDYGFLGLKRGHHMCQSVIRENIREIAPRGASVSLLPDDLDAPKPASGNARKSQSCVPALEIVTPRVIEILREAWRSVCDGYPELTHVSIEGGLTSFAFAIAQQMRRHRR